MPAPFFMALAKDYSRAFLYMLTGVWGVTLTMCSVQAGLCEWRAKGVNGACADQWQLAVVTASGMGQTLFSLFSPPPSRSPSSSSRQS